MRTDNDTHVHWNETTTTLNKDVLEVVKGLCKQALFDLLFAM